MVDLQDLAGSLRQGPIRVFQWPCDELFYLEAEPLDALTNPDAVFKGADALLKTVTGLSRARGRYPEEVIPISVLWTDGKGNWVRQRLRASVQVRVVSRVRGETPESNAQGAVTPSEALILVSLSDARVMQVLTDLGGPIDLPRLRRVFEHIWTEFNSKNETKATAAMAAAGLSSASEIRRFRETVNRSPCEPAHSEFRFDPYHAPMSLNEAQAWLRGVIDRWLMAKRSNFGIKL